MTEQTAMNFGQVNDLAVLDSNQGKGEADVAHQQEPAQAMAQACSADGLSIEHAPSIPMPTFEELYAFIRDEYIHSRFEERNSWWPKDEIRYSELIVRGYWDDLLKTGSGTIGHFESRRGRVVYFNRALQITNPDAPPIEIKYKSHSLSNPMSGDWS